MLSGYAPQTRSRPGLQYKVRNWYRGTCGHPNQGYKPDVEMKRNRLFYLELLSSPGKLKYAVLGSMLVILHELTVEKPAERKLARGQLESGQSRTHLHTLPWV